MRLSRRALLRLAMLGSIGASLAYGEQATRPVGLIAFYRWYLAGQRRRLFDPPATVALQRVPSYDGDLVAPLRAGWRAGGLPAVAGKRVLIKPNLVDQVEARPIHTNPRLVGALVDLLREMGAAAIAVGDGPAFRRDGLAVAAEAGLRAELAARDVPFVDLNYDDPAPVPVSSGWFRSDSVLWLPASVRTADLVISVPKLKTHHWATVSLSMKNLFGVVPGVRYGWPKNILHINGIHASILALLPLMPPTVGIVDGIVGMEGDGPLYGTPVSHGVLAFGADLVALDFACTRLIGLDPDRVPYLKAAAWSGLGQGDKVIFAGAPFTGLRRRYAPPPVMEMLTG
ncbi:MAG: DUF362 domain-containing protein [Ardenticatenaceae bacterium]|nr:DUF362 domain-containing protein [Ardenticatenaceae bacterium]